jgi:hypothetical protein
MGLISAVAAAGLILGSASAIASPPPMPDTARLAQDAEPMYGIKRPPPPIVDIAPEKIRQVLAAALEGHQLGQELKIKSVQEGLPRVRVFTVLHESSPCETCKEFLKVLAVVEYEDARDKVGKVGIMKSEKDLNDLLVRQKLSGKEKAVFLVAQLVQALWRPVNGGLQGLRGDQTVDPEEAALEKDGKGFNASYLYKKGPKLWSLTVSLDKDGNFTGLSVVEKADK